MGVWYRGEIRGNIDPSGARASLHQWIELLLSGCSFKELPRRVRGGGGSAAHSLCGPPVLPVPPAAGVQGGWALLAHAEMHDPSSVPHADLRSEPCRRQVPILVLRLSAEEDEEVFWRDCVLWTGKGLKT